MAQTYHDLAHDKANRYHGALHALPGMPTLRNLRGHMVDGYSDEGARRKASMHRNGKILLSFLADHAHMATDRVQVRSNLGGMAVSGEVTLHTDWVWAQVSQLGQRVVIMYRRPMNSANSVRWDADGANRFIHLDEPDDARLDAQMRMMLDCFTRWEEAGLRQRIEADHTR